MIDVSLMVSWTWQDSTLKYLRLQSSRLMQNGVTRIHEDVREKELFHIVFENGDHIFEVLERPEKGQNPVRFEFLNHGTTREGWIDAIKETQSAATEVFDTVVNSKGYKAQLEALKTQLQSSK